MRFILLFIFAPLFTPASFTTNMHSPQNIILLVADSLRYDSVYANNNINLPYTLQNALQFTQARSSGCWTLPATASLFTGLMPHQHGATSQTRYVSANVPTLAQKLKELGYETYQVTANVATTEIFGLHRGFDQVIKTWKIVPAKFNRLQQFLVLIGKPRIRRMLFSKDMLVSKMSEDIEANKTWLQFTHEDTFNQARQIIEQNEKLGKKSFIFVNLMESHFPYHVAPTFHMLSPGIINKFREIMGLFHALNQTFLKTGKLNIKPDMLQTLRHRQRKSWELIAPSVDAFICEMHHERNTLLAFCADHGENFGDQGWLYHFSNVTEAGNRVPLFILPPYHHRSATTDIAINTKDLYHTFLHAAGANTNQPSLLLEPQASVPVMQSYWYNNHGKTLPQYKYNQICFINEENRYLFRAGKWYTAPVALHTEPEALFTPLPGNTNPLYDCINNPTLRKNMLSILSDFLVFADKVGTGK